MERFQKLQAIVGMGKMAMVEGTMITPEVAELVLEKTTVEEFFNLDMKKLCRKAYYIA